MSTTGNTSKGALGNLYQTTLKDSSGFSIADGTYANLEPPAATPQATVYIGSYNRLDYTSVTYDLDVSSHAVANLSWMVNQTARTLALAIAQESKLENNTTGVITTGIINEAQVSVNAGTISTLIGHRAAITGNTGTISNYYGFYFPDHSAISGITSRFSFINTDASAPIYSVAPIVTAASVVSTTAQFSEISDPVAPSANEAKLFVRDNGSGKTQLCVRFATGAIQVISTEP